MLVVQPQDPEFGAQLEGFGMLDKSNRISKIKGGVVVDDDHRFGLKGTEN